MAKIHLLRNPRTAWEYDALWSFTLICWVFSHDMSIQYVFLYCRTLMEFWEQCKLKNHLSMKKSSLSRCLLKLKVQPTSKILKLYTTISLTLTTNCFTLMFKWKLDKCIMNSDNHLRRFGESLYNKLILNIKRKKNHAFVENASAWHVQTIKYEPWFLSKKLHT